MRVARLLRKYRQSLNPPYNRKDALTILGTILLLLAIPLTALAIKNIQDLRSKAQSSPPPAGFSVESEREVCNLLGPDATASQITGQDGGDSIEHSGVGKSFWTFGDTTMVGSGSYPAINNNVAYTTDFDASDCFNLTYKKDLVTGKAVELISKNPALGEIAVWPDGMFIQNQAQNEVYFYYFSVVSCSSCALYTFDIQWMGLAKFNTSTLTSTRVATIWDNRSTTDDVWAAHPVVVNESGTDYLYVFLDVRNNQAFSNVRLAKVPLSQATAPSAYRYWNGADFSATSISQAAGLWVQSTELNGVSVSFNQYLGKWLAVYTTGSGGSTYNRVVARSADTLIGPWSDEVTLIDCSRYQTGPGFLCYTGRQHNEFEKASGQTIYVTYVNTNAYRVYLHEVTLTKAKPGDLNGDGNVDILDLSRLISYWGQSGGVADINGDGTVNIYDLSILLSNWGT